MTATALPRHAVLCLCLLPVLTVPATAAPLKSRLATQVLAQDAYIKASNTGTSDSFGAAVAMDGNTLVVGAIREASSATGVNGDEHDNTSSTAGAAYVFVRGGQGWTQQAYLKASNTDSGDGFGGAVTISGETIAIGARMEDSAGVGVGGVQTNNDAASSGAVYVFVRSGSIWSQQAYLKASNPDPGDEFGTSVALDGDRLLVGAPYEASSAMGVDGPQTNNAATSSGAAYVFSRLGTTWTQEAYLKASNTDDGDQFGQSVSLSSATIVVGARLEDSAATAIDGDQADNSAPAAGAAYVFAHNGSAWAQQAYLKAINAEAEDLFGAAVSVSGETVVVGVLNEDSSATGVGGDPFNNDAFRTGAVFVFTRASSVWTQQAYLKAGVTSVVDGFGEALVLSGDRLLVGVPDEDGSSTRINEDPADNNAPQSGAAYLFERNGATWTQIAYLKASNTETGDLLGTSVAQSGNYLAAGAWGEDSHALGVNGTQTSNAAPASGATYVFDLAATPPVPIGVDLCSGDGGDQMGCTACPCSNNAPVGTIGGCLNSVFTSARLSATGDPSVSLPADATDDLRFELENAPPFSFCILNSGDAVAPTDPMSACFGLDSGVRAVQFDGLRCAVVNTRRHGGRSCDVHGDVGVAGNPWGGEGGPPAGIANAGSGFVSGQTRYFQVIHRDDALLSCMRGLNTSQAIQITFQP